jgi:dTDP-4-amino-4,6-dideoxygalactose transaminase
MHLPYTKQHISKKDALEVSKALFQEKITTGKYVKKFEEEFKKYTECKFALTCSSGTSGIHLAFLAIGLTKGDNIIIPAINFIASYNMSLVLKANIFLADVDPITGQMTPETLIKCIKNNNIKKIKAVVTMYLGGFPNNVIEFYKLKKKFNFYLIEDACHALGASYKFKNKYLKIGSCFHSDICIFSLHPAKIITSGEGGIVTTRSIKFYKKINYLRSHGIIRSKKHWIYDVSFPGYNYRLSDINCALALSQLKKIKIFLEKRNFLFNNYVKILTKKKYVNFPLNIKDCLPSYHLFIISIDFRKLKIIKNKLFEYLLKKKITVQYHYIPIYKFKVFASKNNSFNGSDIFYKNSLSIPFYYDLKESEQVRVCNNIFNFIINKKK